MDTYNFTEIMRLSWSQAWNILDRAVKRGRERKRGKPSVIGVDEKSYRKGHKYITLIYDMDECHEVYAVQIPPHPLLQVIIDHAWFFAVRAKKFRTLFMDYVYFHSLLCGIQ